MNKKNDIRKSPHSIKAEKAVLGCMLLNKDAVYKAIQILNKDSFYENAHKIIFSSIMELFKNEKTIDIIIIIDFLDKNDNLKKVGDSYYITGLIEEAPSSENVEYYADIVRKRSILRQLITATANINDTVFNPQGKSSEQILETAEQIVFEIAEQEDKGRKTYQNINY